MDGRARLAVLSSFTALAFLGFAVGSHAELDVPPHEILGVLEETSATSWRPSMLAARRKVVGECGLTDLPVAMDLLGPVFRESLEHRFAWKVASGNDEAVSLIATPRDSVERMFLGRIELTVSRKTGEIDSLRFLDRRGATSTAAAGASGTNAIRLVSGVEYSVAADGTQTSGEDVERILDAWARSTGTIRNVKLSFERYRYDRAFHLETRAIGKFVYVAPNTGMYRIHPAPIPVGTESRVLGSDGQRFTLRTDSPQSLLWDGATVTIADDAHRTMQQLNLPKRDAGIQPVVGSWDNVWAQLTEPQAALPCVVAVNSKDLLQRFQITIVRNDDQQIVLRCLPADVATKHQLAEIMVIIDPQTHLTKATKFIGPSGDLEIVHVFLYEEINKPDLQQAWAPDLRDYRTMEMPPPAPPAE